MKIRNLITTGLILAGFATMAQAQSYYGGGYAPGPISRDLRQQSAMSARVEADRRAVEHDRWEVNHSPRFVARGEYRDFRFDRERLEHERRELNRLRYQNRY
jgi:hypothetical protein